MKNKTLTIVTEGGMTFGFGHITRCLSISHQFKKYGYKIDFIINGDNSLNNLLQDEDFIIFDWEKNLDKLLSLLDSSIILIDSIEIPDEQIKAIENKNIPIIFIDDEKRRNILNSGFVIDWTVLSDKQNYFNPKKNNVTYFLGSKFTPLRDDFSNAFLNPIKNNIQNILISFGGSDVRNLTPKVLRLLNNNYPDLTKNIIIGNGFSNIEEVENLKTKNVNFIFNATSQDMIRFMQTCDLAISAGGQTLYELARIGTPTIAIILVENAKDDTIGWEKVGSLVNIGWWNDEDMLSNLDGSINNLQDYECRKLMQNCGQKYINQNGAKYLVEKILEKL